jgi:hypothetical protein
MTQIQAADQRTPTLICAMCYRPITTANPGFLIGGGAVVHRTCAGVSP